MIGGSIHKTPITTIEKAAVKTIISRQIEGIDEAIDAVVYKLYNLTKDKIKVVEGE